MNYRKVIILFILFVSANSVFGQVNYFVPEYGVGVRGGATTSWVSFSPSVAQSSTYGLQAGGVFRYVSAKYFGVQVEANFTGVYSIILSGNHNRLVHLEKMSRGVYSIILSGNHNCCVFFL